MATKRQIDGWLKTLERRQKAVAAERDKIDVALDEMNGLRESCDKAWASLQDARDALSELV